MASSPVGVPAKSVGLRRRFDRDPVGGQRVTDRTGVIERSLRQAHRNGRGVKGETGDGTQCGKNVVGSNGGGYLPDNQVQYRTRRSLGLNGGARHDGGDDR